MKRFFVEFLLTLIILGILERNFQLLSNWVMNFMVYLVIFICVDLLARLITGQSWVTSIAKKR